MSVSSPDSESSAAQPRPSTTTLAQLKHHRGAVTYAPSCLRPGPDFDLELEHVRRRLILVIGTPRCQWGKLFYRS
eukprot:459744-Rhodomonas_salina.1